jgi:tetratricopeptide (TPR) repeat protein
VSDWRKLIRRKLLKENCMNKFIFVRAIVAIVFFGLFGASWSANASSAKCVAYSIREPIALTSAIAENTLSLLFDEAESFYKAERFKQAAEGYLTLLELSPTHEMSWLRLGNMQQNLGCIDLAREAFERLSPSGIDPVSDVQVRALLNLAIMRAEQTEVLLRQLEQVSLEGNLASVRDRLLERFGRGLAQAPLARLATVAPPAVAAVAAAALAPIALAKPQVAVPVGFAASPAPAPAPATPKRATGKARTQSKAALVDPVAVSSLPVIQYIGGLEPKR